ncbi:MAG: type II toxin-antitoxin system VapC family toxin [Caulobacteraceae bacterium]
MFVDASALRAILLGEDDAGLFIDKIEAAPRRVTSAIAVFETVRAVLREARGDAGRAREIVAAFLREAEIECVEIGAAECEAALEAMGRFGKGRHPAALNMGDCFAYACARSRGSPLLFKGDDFGKTDIAAA